MAEGGNADQKSDYTFGQVAIRENVCTFEQVKECLDVQNKLRNIGIAPKKLGEILIEKGYMTADQAAKITELQSKPGASTSTAPKAAAPGARGGAKPAPKAGAKAGTKTGRHPQGKVTIPGYEILSRLGQGAMGTVYKGRQVSMDRLVAIKVMALKYSKDPQFVERFVREARAVAKLNHENIISGIDVGEVQGIHYFVMEFIDGAPVTDQMKKTRRVDEARCLEIGLGIAKALAHAHRHSIVHRDVKPENIMITSAGVAKLCDLGLAKQQKGDAGLTMDGMSVGTPNYISPEQARGEEDIDIRADIYSLGASLYHMSTGTPVFSGANPMVVMTKHVTEQPDPPKARFKGLSDGFNNLVMKMMSKRREDRHQTPDAVITDIELLQRGGTIVAPAQGGGDHGGTIRIQGESKPASPVSVSPPTARAHARHHRIVTSSGSGSSPMVPLLAGAGVVALIIVLVMVFSGGSDPVPPGGGNPYGNGGSTAGNGGDPDPPNPGGGTESREDVIKAQIRSFHEIAKSRIEKAAAKHIENLYEQIETRIKDHEGKGEFVAVKLWQEHREVFKQEVNEIVNRRHWEPIRTKAEELLRDENLEGVFKELGKFEEGLAWFKKPNEPTEAGKAYEELMTRVNRRVTDAYVAGMRQAEGEFRNPATRDTAYQTLDATAVGKSSDQKVKIEQKRMEFIQKEIDELVGKPPTRAGYEKAKARVDQLKTLHVGKVRVQRELDLLKSGIDKRISSMISQIASQAGPMFQAFLPAFDTALKDRDLAAARRELHALLLETPVVGRQFLVATPDTSLLEAWLDPARVAPFADLRGVADLAAKGYLAAQNGAGADPKKVYFRIRAAALLEDLVETAVRGAGTAGSRLSTLAPTLKNALGAGATARTAGGPVALDVRGGNVPRINVSPRTPPSLTEDDIVALARESLGGAKADADPVFRLEAFLLYWYAGQKSPAKSHYDKLPPTEQQLGMDAFAPKLQGVTSAADEAAVKQLYEDGYNLLIKQRDQAGAARKFRECLDKYSGTEYMKTRVPPSNKTRTEIIMGLLKAIGR